MSWLTKALASSIGKKIIMSVTGLFLVIFLLGHLAGNLQLLMKDGGEAFNMYADFMMHNPAIQIIAWVTKIGILIHVIYAIILTRQNQAARPVKYAKNKASANSHWTSRFMPQWGIVILVFIVIHLIDFWAKAHYGPIEDITYGEVTVANLFAVVQQKFQVTWVVAFYAISMLMIAFHLWHGVKSGFQSLGINHSKYNPIIANLGALIAVIVPILFAVIPVYMYIVY